MWCTTAGRQKRYATAETQKGLPNSIRGAVRRTIAQIKRPVAQCCALLRNAAHCCVKHKADR